MAQAITLNTIFSWWQKKDGWGEWQKSSYGRKCTITSNKGVWSPKSLASTLTWVYRKIAILHFLVIEGHTLIVNVFKYLSWNMCICIVTHTHMTNIYIFVKYVYIYTHIWQIYIHTHIYVYTYTYDKTWSTGEGNGKPLHYSCLGNPMNSMERQKDMTLKDELPGQ